MLAEHRANSGQNRGQVGVLAVLGIGLLENPPNFSVKAGEGLGKRLQGMHPPLDTASVRVRTALVKLLCWPAALAALGTNQSRTSPAVPKQHGCAPLDP